MDEPGHKGEGDGTEHRPLFDNPIVLACALGEQRTNPRCRPLLFPQRADPGAEPFGFGDESRVLEPGSL